MNRLVLAIEASGAAASCALRLPDGRRFVRRGEPRRDDLVALVAATFTEAGAARADLAELRIDVGPGSYTGLRVAIAFARMLASLHPTLTLLQATSLALAALVARPTAAPQARLRPILDARRGRLHHAAYRAADLAVELPPRADPPDTVLASLLPGDLVLAAAELHPTLIVPNVLLAPMPELTAADLLHPDAPLHPISPQHLEPLYLMDSYAG